MNVKHRRCAEPNCNTRPAFNWKGQEKGAYCNKHKEKGMINVDKKEPRAGRHAVHTAQNDVALSCHRYGSMALPSDMSFQSFPAAECDALKAKYSSSSES